MAENENEIDKLKQMLMKKEYEIAELRIALENSVLINEQLRLALIEKDESDKYYQNQLGMRIKELEMELQSLINHGYIHTNQTTSINNNIRYKMNSRYGTREDNENIGSGYHNSMINNNGNGNDNNIDINPSYYEIPRYHSTRMSALSYSSSSMAAAVPPSSSSSSSMYPSREMLTPRSSSTSTTTLQKYEQPTRSRQTMTTTASTTTTSSTAKKRPPFIPSGIASHRNTISIRQEAEKERKLSELKGLYNQTR